MEWHARIAALTVEAKRLMLAIKEAVRVLGKGIKSEWWKFWLTLEILYMGLMVETREYDWTMLWAVMLYGSLYLGKIFEVRV